MKQSKLIAAYSIIAKLNASGMKDASMATQLKFYNLQKQLQPAYDFQIKKEKEIFDENPPTKIEDGNAFYEKEDGTPDTEKLQICKEKLEELNELDNDTIKIEPVHITTEEAKLLKPGNNQNIIGILEGIVEIDTPTFSVELL